MSSPKSREPLKCCQCRLDAQFEADGVLTCEFHVKHVLWTLLATRYDVVVKAVTKS